MEVMEIWNSWQKNILDLIPKRKEYANENEKVSDSDNGFGINRRVNAVGIFCR